MMQVLIKQQTVKETTSTLHKLHVTERSHLVLKLSRSCNHTSSKSLLPLSNDCRWCTDQAYLICPQSVLSSWTSFILVL